MTHRQIWQTLGRVLLASILASTVAPISNASFLALPFSYTTTLAGSVDNITNTAQIGSGTATAYTPVGGGGSYVFGSGTQRITITLNPLGSAQSTVPVNGTPVAPATTNSFDAQSSTHNFSTDFTEYTIGQLTVAFSSGAFSLQNVFHSNALNINFAFATNLTIAQANNKSVSGLLGFGGTLTLTQNASNLTDFSISTNLDPKSAVSNPKFRGTGTAVSALIQEDSGLDRFAGNHIDSTGMTDFLASTSTITNPAGYFRAYIGAGYTLETQDDIDRANQSEAATPSANVTLSSVPEPSSLFLAVTGLISAAGWIRHRKHRVNAALNQSLNESLEVKITHLESVDSGVGYGSLQSES